MTYLILISHWINCAVLLCLKQSTSDSLPTTVSEATGNHDFIIPNKAIAFTHRRDSKNFRRRVHGCTIDIHSLLISSTSRSNCSVILPQISIKGHLKTLKILYRLTQFPTPIREIGDNTHGSMGLRGSTAIGDSGPISTNYRQYLLSWAMFKMFPCVRSVALCTGTCISASIPVARSSGVTTSYADYTRVHGPSDGYRGWYTMLIELGLSSSSSEFHYLRDHC